MIVVVRVGALRRDIAVNGSKRLLPDDVRAIGFSGLFCLGAILGTLGHAQAQATASSDTHWRVDRAHLECVVRRANDYRALGGDPIVVVPAACERTVDPAQALRELSLNSGGMFGTDSGDKDKADKVRSILYVSSHEFDCLARLLKATEEPVVFVPKIDLCDFE